MKSAVVLVALSVLTVQAASRADEPLKIDRMAFAKVSDSVDNRFKELWPEYPADVVGVTRTLYIRGYGAIVSGELNLAPSSGTSPFHQTITKDDISRAHQKKVQRMPQLKTALQNLLIQAASDLRDVPDNEEVAIAVSLFYWHWEDRAGLPDQVVIHAPKKTIVAAAHDKSLAAGLRVDEY